MRCRSLTIALSVAAALLGARDVDAQNALDRNLQQGSGGVNQQAPLPYAIDGGNALITGNVTGNSGFRGNVDYVAPGQFQGNVGSDDLFRFRAQSFSPGASPLSSSAAAARGNLASPQSPFTPTVVLPSSSAVSVGDVAGGGEYVGAATRIGGLRLPVETATAITGLTVQPQQVLGVLRQVDGTLLQINASPLLGVRREVVGTVLPAPADTTTPAAGDLPRDTPAVNQVALPPPSLSLGVQLQAQQDPAMLSGAWAQTQAQVVGDLEKRLLGPRPGDDAAQPGDGMADPYLSILARVQARHVAGDSAQPAPGADPASAPRLAPPTPEQRAAAEAARVKAMHDARGLRQPDAAVTNPADAETQARTDPRLQQWIIALDYDLPALATLAGSRQDRVNSLLQQAEKALVEGRYFDAEGRYRQVLIADPQRPLARVGLVHAQLGAGLIRSAALNLRTVLTEHPELIAARYEARLLPAGERLAWVRGQLEQMLRLTTRPEPALLLAYLGYQTQAGDLTAYGLDLAAARSPQDPLIPLLRRLWLPQNSNP
jgi:hypothetical protein